MFFNALWFPEFQISVFVYSNQSNEPITFIKYDNVGHCSYVYFE
jgi:hypothetical protein